jgi:hypothetical protein
MRRVGSAQCASSITTSAFAGQIHDERGEGLRICFAARRRLVGAEQRSDGSRALGRCSTQRGIDIAAPSQIVDDRMQCRLPVPRGRLPTRNAARCSGDQRLHKARLSHAGFADERETGTFLSRPACAQPREVGFTTDERTAVSSDLVRA